MLNRPHLCSGLLSGLSTSHGSVACYCPSVYLQSRGVPGQACLRHNSLMPPQL